MDDLISRSAALNAIITNEETERVMNTETDNTEER